MEKMENPIQKIIDGTKSCILTVHSDNRVRLWDISDGRCINISPHNAFPGASEIH